MAAYQDYLKRTICQPECLRNATFPAEDLLQYLRRDIEENIMKGEAGRALAVLPNLLKSRN
jgi:hypothetical protein